MINPDVAKDIYEALLPKPPDPKLLIPTVDPQQVTLADQPKSIGIFTELFGDQPAYLLRAARSNPEEFTADVVRLLTELYVGTKKLDALTDQEQQLLNKATVQYATTNWQVKTANKTPRKPYVRRTVVAAPTVKNDVTSEQDLPGFWWL